MARKRRQEDNHEFQRLSQFVVTVSQFILRDQPEAADSLRAVERISTEGCSLSGIRMARDAVEWCQDLTGERLIRLDSELASNALPTISAMRNTTYRKALAVLARGKVQTEEEWQLLSGFVGNDADNMLSATERKEADRLIHEFKRKD